MNRTPSRLNAFTLIELLVVIAIIAILAAILFPVFAQAKDAAKKSVGLSNVKQLDTGYALYMNDYDDTYIFSVTERNSPQYSTSETQAEAAVFSTRALTYPYTKSNDLWKDPSTQPWPTPAPEQWYTVDYGTNFNEGNFQNLEGSLYKPANAPFALAYQTPSTSGSPTGQFTGTPVSLCGESVPGLSDFGVNDTVTSTSLAAPANFILMADAARLTSATWTPSRGGLYPQPWVFDDSDSSFACKTQARPYPHHGDAVVTAGAGPDGTTLVSGGVNVGYADTHAKWRNLSATWRSYDDNDWRRDPSTP
jgi:prepilin-type N-terminal cleavage/methylation domain-containing protein